MFYQLLFSRKRFGFENYIHFRVFLKNVEAVNFFSLIFFFSHHLKKKKKFCFLTEKIIEILIQNDLDGVKNLHLVNN